MHPVLIADARERKFNETVQMIDCNKNRLAKMNRDSCSDAVRAVANFFLETDTFQDFCDDH